MTRRQKRGEFSPIARALLDGPDYRKLSPTARHTFLNLKVMFGPSGIEVHYPAALAATLEETTGWPAKSITGALAELDGAGWVQRESNVVWLVGHLLYHPGMSSENPKHRTGVQNHVAGLPRLLLVRRFIEAHPAFFVDVPEVLASYPTVPALAVVRDAKGPGMAMGSLSNHAVRSTQYEIPKTQTQNEELSCVPDGTPQGPTFAEFWSAYPKRKGTNSRKDAERCFFARVKEGEDPAAMVAGANAYRVHCDSEGKTRTPFVMQASRFLGPGKHYLEVDSFSTDQGPNPPIVLPDGAGFTDYGLEATAQVPNAGKLARLRAAWLQTPEGRQAVAEWERGKTAKKTAKPEIRTAPSSEYAAALGG